MEHLVWPGAVVLLGVFFMVMFRKPIASFLSRVEKVSKTGVETTPLAQKPIEAVVDMEGAENFLRPLDSQALRLREATLTNWLKEQGLTDRSDIVKTLVRHLVVSAQASHFQRIAGIVWGSQLELLLHLNASPESVPEESLHPFYDMAAEERPGLLGYYSFEEYLGFLSGAGLIGSAEGAFWITDEGQDFLVFLARTGNTARRPL